MELTRDLLLANFEYCPETGKLYRLSKSLRNPVPRREVGKTYGPTCKYLQNRFQGKLYLTHTLIFIILHGYRPEQVDHINGDVLDNRACNLRACTHAENQRNKGLTTANKSGYKGVWFNTRKQRWIAEIWVNKQKHYLGSSTNIDEAAEMYRKAAGLYHGEFGRV